MIFAPVEDRQNSIILVGDDIKRSINEVRLLYTVLNKDAISYMNRVHFDN